MGKVPHIKIDGELKPQPLLTRSIKRKKHDPAVVQQTENAIKRILRLCANNVDLAQARLMKQVSSKTKNFSDLQVIKR